MPRNAKCIQDKQCKASMCILIKINRPSPPHSKSVMPPVLLKDFMGVGGLFTVQSISCRRTPVL